MKRPYIYVLPKRDFFTRGPRGSVTHALGVVEGLIESGHHVTVVGGPGVASNLSHSPTDAARVVQIVAPTRRWERSLIDVVEATRVCDSVTLVRYAPRHLFTIRSLCASGRTLIEVNSLFAQQGRVRRFGTLGRWVAQAVDKGALSRAFGVYAVSTPTANRVRRMTDAPVRVLRNAASQATLDHEPVRISGADGGQFSVLYAGTLQKYYDFIPIVVAIEHLRAHV